MMPSNPNATAIANKYYCGSKHSIKLNDERRRRRRKKAVPRAAAGYARQLKIAHLRTPSYISLHFKQLTINVHVVIVINKTQCGHHQTTKEEP